MLTAEEEAAREARAKLVTEQWVGLRGELRNHRLEESSSRDNSRNNSTGLIASTNDGELPSAPKDPAMSGAFTAINNKRRSSPVNLSRQPPQDTSSIAGMSVASDKSRRSSAKRRECERCKKVQPLDEILLANCAGCQRCFHKACVNASDDVATDGRWRCRKCCDRLRNGDNPSRMASQGHREGSDPQRSRRLIELTGGDVPKASSALAASSDPASLVNDTAITKQGVEDQAGVKQQTLIRQDLIRKDSHITLQPSANGQSTETTWRNPAWTAQLDWAFTPRPRVSSPELGEDSSFCRIYRSSSDVGTSTPLPGTARTLVLGADALAPVPTPHPDAVPGERSTLSRVVLIGMALLEAPGHRLQAHSIHEWIGKHIPGYHKSDKQMHNGVSNALSTRAKGSNPLFEKQDPDGPGKASWWAIKPGMEYKFKPWDHKNKCILGGGDQTSIVPPKRKRQKTEQSFESVVNDESDMTTDEPRRLMIRLKLPRKPDTEDDDIDMHDAIKDSETVSPNISRALDAGEAFPTGKAATAKPLNGVGVQVPADQDDDGGSERSRSPSPYSSLFRRHPPLQPSTTRITSQVATTHEGAPAAARLTAMLGRSSIYTVAAEMPLVLEAGSAGVCPSMSREIGTQTNALPESGGEDINMIDGIVDAADTEESPSTSDEEYESRITANIRAKSQNFTVRDISESFPTATESVPQSVINARPTRKQRMRMPGNEHISRLGHNTAVRRYKAICDQLGRKGGGDGSDKEEQSNEYGVADIDFENSQPKQYESLEDLVEMPESVVPMLYEQQLVFTDGGKNRNARGRAGRAKNIYRIGANVLHR